MKTTLIQISAGKGPLECQRVVFLVAEILKITLKKHCIEWELIQAEPSLHKETYLSISLLIKDNAAQIQNEWEGSIQWIAESPYRHHHKRKNWFVNIYFYDMEAIPTFNEQAVIYESYRASGPGGQHINKVETAVRARHISSGLTATSMEARAQLANKQNALAKLKSLFLQALTDQANEQKTINWKQHGQLQRGNPVKTFKSKL